MHWILTILTVPYFFLLLWLYWCLRKIKRYKNGKTPVLKLSVIIACRNESDNLKKILPDLACQIYPADQFEVIVVDDNSSDDTQGVASGFEGINNMKVLGNSGHGKKRAVATGVNEASGELILTTDADCRIGRNWMSTIASFYIRYMPDMIICPVILDQGKGFFGKFQELEFLSLQGITTGSAAAGRSTMCNGANLAFTKETYLRHSGNLRNDIPSGDDVFFLHSLKKEGARIFWLESPDAMVTTAQAQNPLLFFKQRRRWISKGRAYSDRFTIWLAIVTFVTISAQIISLAAGIFNQVFLLPFLAILVLKSVPDLLILENTTGRYGRKDLLKWFLPSQFVYPFYVLAVTLSLSGNMIRKLISFPFPTGT